MEFYFVCPCRVKPDVTDVLTREEAMKQMGCYDCPYYECDDDDECDGAVRISGPRRIISVP